MLEFHITFTILLDVVDEGVGRQGGHNGARDPGREASQSGRVAVSNLATKCKDFFLSLENHIRRSRVLEGHDVGLSAGYMCGLCNKTERGGKCKESEEERTDMLKYDPFFYENAESEKFKCLLMSNGFLSWSTCCSLFSCCKTKAFTGSTGSAAEATAAAAMTVAMAKNLMMSVLVNGLVGESNCAIF